MKNPFSKNTNKSIGTEKIKVYDGIYVEILASRDIGNEKEEVDVVELFNDDGEPMVFELLARVDYLGTMYFLITAFEENEPEDPERSDVFVMKEFARGKERMLEPVEDETLVKLIFDAFHKAAGDQFNFV